MGGGRGRVEPRQLRPHRRAARFVDAILREGEHLTRHQASLLRRPCGPAALRARPEKIWPWVQGHNVERPRPASGPILAKVTRVTRRTYPAVSGARVCARAP